ncbi:hypothetical protein PROAA_1350021 [Candidatus Propionivibrio aalborgensis]|uniref:Uncharacterized protein n=1 Tax=Candidatus Propionivibrio aalborgensis TaxID=1860101 RepID=A0A1A8XI05_9RHOO|nr:hypothetical protein PROAA_1350021 [Candidatus Propionivibrio aalborgensis]
MGEYVLKILRARKRGGRKSKLARGAIITYISVLRIHILSNAVRMFLASYFAMALRFAKECNKSCF